MTVKPVRPYPAQIMEYVAHYFGREEARLFEPAGRVLRCMRQGPRACGRQGYVFRDNTPSSGGVPWERYAVVWDGKTPADRSAFEHGLVDPDLPYGIDLCVSARILGGPFCCGWCGE